MFKGESKLDCTFISSYVSDNQTQIEYGALGRIFKITNCKNEKCWNEELDTEITFSTISGVSSTALYKYILRFVHGNQRDLYICFYNTNLLLYVNSDVLDIIATEQKTDSLKKEFTYFVDKLYD